MLAGHQAVERDQRQPGLLRRHRARCPRPPDSARSRAEALRRLPGRIGDRGDPPGKRFEEPPEDLTMRDYTVHTASQAAAFAAAAAATVKLCSRCGKTKP